MVIRLRQDCPLFGRTMTDKEQGGRSAGRLQQGTDDAEH
jgi:hypothetical protein